VTTLGNLVTQVQLLALSDMREEMNYLGATINTSATTITLAANETLGSIQPGAYIQIDYEYMLVTAAASATNITVERGFGGSTPASHSSGAVINVNPRFPAVQIIQAINQDIDDLSAPANGLYQMLELSTTFIPVQQGYDMTGVDPSTVLELFEVRAYEYGPSQKYPIIPMSAVKVQRNANTSVFPSGMSFTLDQGGYPGRELRVQYKASFTTPLVNASDDVLSVTGLHVQAHDIPPLGAAARLMQFRELKRSFTEAQGEPRRAQEVPVGSSLTASKGIEMLRMQRIEAERTRLNKMYQRQAR
jgi:hypothetical protein